MVTNYSMLEYMLMRPLERPVFDKTRAWLSRNPSERFLVVLDEAHLYREQLVPKWVCCSVVCVTVWILRLNGFKSSALRRASTTQAARAPSAQVSLERP